jgi:hypothetical protein
LISLPEIAYTNSPKAKLAAILKGKEDVEVGRIVISEENGTVAALLGQETRTVLALNRII